MADVQLPAARAAYPASLRIGIFTSGKNGISNKQLGRGILYDNVDGALRLKLDTSENTEFKVGETLTVRSVLPLPHVNRRDKDKTLVCRGRVEKVTPGFKKTVVILRIRPID